MMKEELESFAADFSRLVSESGMTIQEIGDSLHIGSSGVLLWKHGHSAPVRSLRSHFLRTLRDEIRRRVLERLARI